MGVDRGLPDLAPGTVRTTIGNLRPTLCPPMTTLLKYLSHLGTGFMSTGMTLRYAFGGLLARGPALQDLTEQAGHLLLGHDGIET